MSVNYRWNQLELASAYDVDAERVHPWYAAVQTEILNELEAALSEGGLLIDLGAGSGRLVEKVLDRYPQARSVLVDQSAAFQEIARQRLSRFGSRVQLVECRLQDAWSKGIGEPPAAIVSMSAIHHLTPSEKSRCYQQAFDLLAPGGLFINGDEVRPASDAEYAAECLRWGDRMQRLIRDRAVSKPMAAALDSWMDRNITRADEPRHSGDDCLETAEAQLGYLAEAGFRPTAVTWHRELWSVLMGRKPKDD